MKTDNFALLLLVFRAYWNLVYFDLRLVRGNFGALHDKVRTFPVRDRKADEKTAPRVCRAVDIACICYWKQVLCLQRSVATACLLKKNGVPATLVLGAQQVPFKAHAWVEVDGRVVNDKAYTPEMYAVLDRC
jgi:hypothetical protein